MKRKRIRSRRKESMNAMLNADVLVQKNTKRRMDDAFCCAPAVNQVREEELAVCA